MGMRRGMQDRYGLDGTVWGVRGEPSRTWAQRGHCWLQTGPVAPLHSGAVLLTQQLYGHNTEASSIPGHPVTLHTCPTEHSTSHSTQQRPWAAVAASSSGSLPCPSRAVPGAELRASLQHHVLPLTQCQLLAPHSSPCMAGASASSSGQDWQAGRSRQFSQALKGDRAFSFPCPAGARQELSCSPDWKQSALTGTPSTSC